MKTSTTRLNKILVFALWLGIWQGLAMIINEEILFVSPLSVILTFLKIGSTIAFWKSILFSMLRVLSGFLVGFVLTLFLAVLSYKIRFLRDFLSPAVSVIKATPVASFIILALFFLSKDLVPFFICVLMVTPIVWSNVLSGLDNLDRGLLEMTKVYKLSFWEKVKHLFLPALKPYLHSALGSGLGLCWKAGIAAEVICRSTPSIGNNIWETKFYFETAEMFTWTATVVILSVIFDKLLGKILKGGAKK